jgi:hypothetical protein
VNIPTSLPRYAQRTTAALLLANPQRLLAASCVLIVPACLRGCLLAWLLAWAWWLAPGRTTGELYPRYLKLIDGRVLLTFTVRCGRNVDGSGTPDHLHHCVNTTDGENVGLRAAFSYDDVSSVLSHSPTVSVDATSSSAVRQARTGLYRCAVCAALALGQVLVRTQYQLQ